ncbi:MAG: DUF1573 domain-containing protein [Saprospiraceae bacterium]|nr:DUF1573 domain-containing protein [Saprospiraceae bacterium]
MRFIIPLALPTILALACSESTQTTEEATAKEIDQTVEVMVPDSSEMDLAASDLQLSVNEEIEKVDKPEVPNAEKTGKRSSIVFEELRYDFGEILHGDRVQHDFVFTNQGEKDLEIKNVRVSCGCTKPSYPFLAIPPGGEGKIGVTYNSVGKKGYQRPTIRVFTNDPDQPEVVLRLTGRVKVIPKEEYEKIKKERQANEPE